MSETAPVTVSPSRAKRAAGGSPGQAVSAAARSRSSSNVGPRLHRRRWVALTLGIVGIVGTAARIDVARADASPPAGSGSGSVQWDAPEGCPSAVEAEARLHDRLAPDLPAPDVHAIVRRDGETFAARIEIHAGELGTVRELGSPSCETLLDVTMLLAATIAEEAATRADAELPHVVAPAEPGPTIPAPIDATQSPATEPIAPTEVAVPTRPAATKPPRRQPELHFDARGFAGLGVAPDVDTGAGGVFGATFPHAVVEIGGSAGVPRTQAIPGAEARVRISWWALEARGCGRMALGSGHRLHGLACASLFGGGYEGEGDGPALARSVPQRDGWLAAGLGPFLTLDLGRWLGLVAGVEGLAFLRRPAVSVEPLDDAVHRVRPLGVRATLGVRVRFSVTDRPRRRDVGP